MARLFFAVEVAGTTASALGSLSSRLKRGALADYLRVVGQEQVHYTLRFLGEEPLERQVVAIRAARAAALGATGFELVPESLGVFPDERRPHTLWIGAGTGGPELVDLALRLGQHLGEHGFEAEDRPFVPHLTLARVKRRPPPDALAALLQEPHETISALRVDAFVLMESRPTPTGTRYVTLETFPLEFPCKPSRSPSTAAPK